MSQLQERPVAIYREERRNKQGNWTCSRMTYKRALFETWRSHYQAWIEKYGEGSYPAGPKRYVSATVTWEDEAP